jgi:hypothetical protein
VGATAVRGSRKARKLPGQPLPRNHPQSDLKATPRPFSELCLRSLCALPLLHVAGYSGVLLAALRPPAGHRPSVSPAGVERTARLDRPGVAPLPASRAAVAAPAARPRILHTRRHDQAERAQCRGLVRAACEGRLWPQQVHQTDLKACRRRAVVARAETAAEEPSAVTIQRLPGPPSGSPCQL